MITVFSVALVFAGFYLPLSRRDPEILRSVIKTVPLTLFAVIALSADAPLALVAGLALSAPGDLALSRAGTRAFLIGLVAFALAHVAYFGLFMAAGSTFPILWAAVLVPLVLSTELWLIPHTGDLRWPVRCYAVLIALMAWAAAGLPADLSLAGWGAAAFMASDLILSAQLFRLKPDSAMYRPAGWALWVLYVGGQAMILLAFVPGIGLF